MKSEKSMCFCFLRGFLQSFNYWILHSSFFTLHFKKLLDSSLLTFNFKNMVVFSFFAGLLFMSMLCVVINKYGAPDMVSTIYYLLGKRGWVFQIVMMLFGAMMMVCLLDSELGEPCLAFFACAGLIFVGAAPRFLEQDERAVHKGAAITSAAASVAWCLTVDWRMVLAFLAWYGVYWVGRDNNSKPWFTAEVTAVMLVLLTYWNGVLV